MPMPDGVHVTEYKPGLFSTWDVYYTSQGKVTSGSFNGVRKIGTVKRFSDNVFIVVECNHPPLTSRNAAVRWLYEREFGTDSQYILGR